MPDAVSNAARLFSIDLYRAEATTPELLTLEGPRDLPAVSDDPITEGELFKASRHNHSPGAGGLPTEFFLLASSVGKCFQKASHVSPILAA